MNITLISVGKLKEKYLKQAIDEYSKRLSRYCKLNIIVRNLCVFCFIYTFYVYPFWIPQRKSIYHTDRSYVEEGYARKA